MPRLLGLFLGENRHDDGEIKARMSEMADGSLLADGKPEGDQQHKARRGVGCTAKHGLVSGASNP